MNLIPIREASKRLLMAKTWLFINEFWTSKQSAAHSLHEASYRACFKPQLPRLFIELPTSAGDSG